MKRRRIQAKDEEEEEEEKKNIKVVNNRIYFYADVNRKSVLELNIALQELRDKMKSTICELDVNSPNIYLYIHSHGGDVYAGLSAMDHIMKCDIPVVTIVDGFVASAATLISLAGKRRLMYSHSQMLIHQIQTEMWGRYEELVDEMANTKVLQDKMRDIYTTLAKIPKTVLDKLMKKEVTLTAEECKKYSIVDEVM